MNFAQNVIKTHLLLIESCCRKYVRKFGKTCLKTYIIKQNFNKFETKKKKHVKLIFQKTRINEYRYIRECAQNNSNIKIITYRIRSEVSLDEFF